MRFEATGFVEGRAHGPLIRLQAPLSFWGGFDLATGRISDRNHPDHGRALTGAIVAMTSGRGSSSSSSVLAEAIRTCVAPHGFILERADPILGVGALVALRLYLRTTPIVLADLTMLAAIGTGDSVAIESGPPNGIGLIEGHER